MNYAVTPENECPSYVCIGIRGVKHSCLIMIGQFNTLQGVALLDNAFSSNTQDYDMYCQT